MQNNETEHLNGPNVGNWEYDPYHRHDQRWWSGKKWSEKVRSNNETRIDPPGVIPKPVSSQSHSGPASPILGMKAPIQKTSLYIPHMLLLGSVLFTITLVLGLVAVFL